MVTVMALWVLQEVEDFWSICASNTFLKMASTILSLVKWNRFLWAGFIWLRIGTTEKGNQRWVQ